MHKGQNSLTINVVSLTT